MKRAHKTLTRIVLYAAVLSLVSPHLWFSGAALGAETTAVDHAAPEPTACRLQIEGRGIERLVLADEREQLTKIARPGDSVSLPAGKYRVREVELAGGFRCYEFGGGADDWIQVTADQSPLLKAGAPLTPQVRVKRRGRLLTLDYDLVDAKGRNYVQRRVENTPPPKFAVSKDGQALGAGSFEYG